MSSTNRGSDRARLDYYVTLINAIKDFLYAHIGGVQADEWEASGGEPIILDPCAGGDSLNPMSYPTALKEVWNVNNIKTIDIRKDSLAEIKDDYLNVKLDYKPDIVITNPPFYLAMEIIQKALKDVADDGSVIMLLRLNFLGSQQRKKFLQENLPSYIYVHSKRMVFTKDGGTDSIEYAHFVWHKNERNKYSKLKVV